MSCDHYDCWKGFLETPEVYTKWHFISHSWLDLLRKHFKKENKMIMMKWSMIFVKCWNLVRFHPVSSTLWGRRTNQRCSSVSSWLRTKTCTVELLTWTSLDFFTEKSGSCSPNAAPLTPSLTPPLSVVVESWHQVNYTLKSDRFILCIPRENSTETVAMRDNTVRTLTIQRCLFWLASCKLAKQFSLQIATRHLQTWNPTILCLDETQALVCKGLQDLCTVSGNICFGGGAIETSVLRVKSKLEEQLFISHCPFSS